jgi:chromatin remodeling complex protein RSC6
MCPLLIYPQLAQLHNHGLAISSNAIWKEFLKAVFSSNIIKIPESSKRRSIKKREKKYWKKGERKKEKEKERKRKAPRVSSNKKGKSIFWEEKNIAISKSFLYEHIFSPHHTISKTLSKIIWENFVALFGPSFNLAIYMTWVISFVLTYELHIFGL